MRKCTSCGEYKSEAEFFFKLKSKKRLHSNCKACYSLKRRLYYKDHYKKYAGEYKSRALIRKKRVKLELQSQLKSFLLDKSCLFCGNADPRVLEFDHIDRETKSFSIARGLTNGLNWDKILDEIEKCQIVCANCHRIRTAEQFNWRK